MEEIDEKIKQGDSICIKEYTNACFMLGLGIANVVYNFNPDVLIIGDEMAHIAPHIMLEQVNETLKSRILPVLYENIEVKISTAVKNSALHGAAITAISQIFDRPEVFISIQ